VQQERQKPVQPVLNPQALQEQPLALLQLA
jgi:hypothetical protein